jgi:hypothetical protein
MHFGLLFIFRFSYFVVSEFSWFLDDDNESSAAGTSSGIITHSTVSVSSKTVARQYNKNEISFGFISSGKE